MTRPDAVGLAPTAVPAVVLAPMAGITDLPFRRIAARLGASLVVSEMVASQEMVQGRPEARARAELGFGEASTAVQLAGRDARWMAEAARLAEAGGARIIDINMGCPARRVTSGWSGSALLRDPGHALQLIEAVSGAVSVPVTLKTRLGWDAACGTVPALARQAEGAGVRMITIHGRTRCQFYTGHADWQAIAPIRAAVSVPVLANGDIDGPQTARAALAASGAAGVMIGRAARGRPWLPGQVAAVLAGRPMPPAPRGAALADLVAAHYEAMLEFYGRDLGLRVARKHLGWYLDAAGPEAPSRADSGVASRRALLTADTPAAVLRLLPGALCDAAAGPSGRRAA